VWAYARRVELGGVDGTALNICFAIVAAVVVLLLVVSAMRRRRDRRGGIAGDGRWNEGPNASAEPPLLSAQRRDQSG
jgi:hypothetical protein